jgi:hypothetical protein
MQGKSCKCINVLSGLLLFISWSEYQIKEQLQFHGCPAGNNETSAATLGMESYADYITPIALSVKVYFFSKMTDF